jgi:hypothetical protein
MNPNETKQKPKQQKPQAAPQKELTEEQKAKNFENFIVSYANKKPKETFAILGRFGYENPKEVPAEKRKEIGDAIKKELANG